MRSFQFDKCIRFSDGFFQWTQSAAFDLYRGAKKEFKIKPFLCTIETIDNHFDGNVCVNPQRSRNKRAAKWVWPLR